MALAKDIIQSMNRAIRAEEKQGHINTGALGSFSDYLLDICSDYGNSFIQPLADYLNELKILAERYQDASPYQRRSILLEIKQLVNKMEAEQHTDNANKPLTPIFFAEDQGNDYEKNERENKAKRDERNITQIAEQSLKKVTDDIPDLQYVKGVGPRRVKQFAKLGITSVQDLLLYYPRRYEIRRKCRFDELRDGELAVVSGVVAGSQISRGKVKVVKLNIVQGNKNLHAIWFNQEYIVKQFPVGTEVTIVGRVQLTKRVPELLATEISKGLDQGPPEQIIPIYSETAGLNSKNIRKVVEVCLEQAEKMFPEYLPPDKIKYLERSEAIKQIHFPSSSEMLKKARSRLVLEEILFLQIALARLRSPKQEQASPVLNKGTALVQKFISLLPFKLTNAQNRVIQEIFKDMANPCKGMTRLLQGDVGSGKTVVAMAAIVQAVGSGFQAAMMAPTEVLAQQHYQSLTTYFRQLGIKVVLLVGNQTKSEREQILGQIYSGKADVVVGTHALIQENVVFNSLGLVITDEQHRFGVRQRTLLQEKGEQPHVLVMTATPIPRTLALTLYGDLQLSVLNEMPAGRKPIITKKITERNKPSLYKFLEKQIQAGRQVYVVCPLVEETEKSDLASATQTFEELKQKFPQRNVALLHGRMKSQHKEDIMSSFRSGEIDILVATTVVEVGVNVPNATVMVIEGAERFGLAQLHQLRGRVGRGDKQSYCILVSNVQDSSRLNILCETEDGFKIADEDLKLRGPGELLGLRQHGVPELKLTDLVKDGIIIEEAYRILQDALQHPAKYHVLFAEVDKVYPQENIGIN